MHIDTSNDLSNLEVVGRRFPFQGDELSIPARFNSLASLLNFHLEEITELLKGGRECIADLAKIDNSREAQDRGLKRLEVLIGVQDNWRLLERDTSLIATTEAFLRSQGFQHEPGRFSARCVGWGKDAVALAEGALCARLQLIDKQGLPPLRHVYPQHFVAPNLEQVETYSVLTGRECCLLAEVFPYFECPLQKSHGSFSVYYQLRKTLSVYGLEFADIFLPNFTQAALWGQQPMICDPDSVVRYEESLGPLKGELELPLLDYLVELWLEENQVFRKDPVSLYEFIVENIQFVEELRGIRRRLTLNDIAKRVSLAFAEERLELLNIESLGFGNDDFNVLMKHHGRWSQVKLALLGL